MEADPSVVKYLKGIQADLRRIITLLDTKVDTRTMRQLQSVVSSNLIAPSATKPYKKVIDLRESMPFGLQEVSTEVTWASANRATFVPFKITADSVLTKIHIVIADVSAGNIDVGVYNSSGTRLVSSGSTAMAAANTTQTFSVTSTTLLKDTLYYSATACSDATAEFKGVYIGPAALDQGNAFNSLGCKDMETAFPLPTTATFASYDPDLIPCQILEFVP